MTAILTFVAAHWLTLVLLVAVVLLWRLWRLERRRAWLYEQLAASQERQIRLLEQWRSVVRRQVAVRDRQVRKSNGKVR